MCITDSRGQVLRRKTSEGVVATLRSGGSNMGG